MFKLLRKKVSNPVSPTLLVEQIHKEFCTASDIALEEANKIIAGVDTSSLDKAKRLKALGFNNSEVQRSDSQKATLESNNAVCKTITDYARKYPNNKFILEEDVIKICNKYGLVVGKVANFLGYVPDKNLVEMENFKVSTEDIPHVLTVSHISFYSDVMDNIKLKNSLSSLYSSNGAVEKYRGQFSTYMAERDVLQAMNVPKDFPNRESIRHIERTVKRDMTFYIAAPLKDFNTEGKSVKNGFLISPDKQISYKIEDPVVLQKVYGGFLIVTAWGPEASDPLIVNEKMN